MITKSEKTDEKEANKGKVKVGKLELNRETVKILTGGEQKRIKGGLVAKGVAVPPPSPSVSCPSVGWGGAGGGGV